MESHPHINLFDQERAWKYLVIGTFPPNTSLRETLYIDYFYGNKGFLWKIIHDLYSKHGYDFFGGDREKNLSEIKRWQNDYCVGITDTILKCARKHPMSSQDSDLINIEYNFGLKSYILQHIHNIEHLIFTSSFGKNSAYENFTKIMGADLPLVANKLVIGLPSPSGASNITFFNTNDEATFGLTPDFFQYVRDHQPQYLLHFRQRWEIKKKKRLSASRPANIDVPSSPKGLVKAYKLWRYQQVLPLEKCS